MKRDIPRDEFYTYPGPASDTLVKHAGALPPARRRSNPLTYLF